MFKTWPQVCRIRVVQRDGALRESNRMILGIASRQLRAAGPRTGSTRARGYLRAGGLGVSDPIYEVLSLRRPDELPG